MVLYERAITNVLQSGTKMGARAHVHARVPVSNLQRRPMGHGKGCRAARRDDHRGHVAQGAAAFRVEEELEEGTILRHKDRVIRAFVPPFVIQDVPVLPLELALDLDIRHRRRQEHDGRGNGPSHERGQLGVITQVNVVKTDVGRPVTCERDTSDLRGKTGDARRLTPKEQCAQPRRQSVEVRNDGRQNSERVQLSGKKAPREVVGGVIEAGG